MENQQPTPMLETRNLSKHFGALKAVNELSLQIQAGERRAIIGPNGAGKTTLFNLLTGVLRPTGGTVSLSGQDITNLPPHRRIPLGLGRTYQVSNLFPALTVEKNVQLAAQGVSSTRFSLFSHGVGDEDVVRRLNRALESVHLEEYKQSTVDELSHGQKRQLEVAFGLAGDPEVLLMDEPAAGLAPKERAQMFELIGNLPEELTVVLIEHDIDLALDLVDSVTCMHHGQIIAEDDPEGIRANPEVQEVYLGESDGESNHAA